jgi:very-long-chain enoyl-CoA reductase
VKEKLGKQVGLDPERLGISDPEKKKLLSDRKALITKHKEVLGGLEILVKDLGMLHICHETEPIELTIAGPQASWTTVFVIEYLGPILIHLSFLAIRPYVYSNPGPLSTSQYLSMAMIVLHFLKREYETLFVHRFSLATMPVFNIFKNSGHYWVFSGFNLAYWIYKPTSYTAKSSPTIDSLNYIGIALYLFGEVANYNAHVVLSKLRKPGGTERGIPKGFGFDTVTCPNYSFELIAWTGIALVTKSWSTVLFGLIAYGQMQIWAQKKERALRQLSDKYNKKRNGIIPGPWRKL